MFDLGYNTGVNLIVDRGATGIARGQATTYSGGSYMDHSTLPLFALKVCTKCGEAKPHTEYHNHSRGGLRPACKVCTNAQNRSVYYKNHDEHLESKRRYRAENPDARRETVRAYDARHALKRKAHAAVKHEIRMGRLPRASELACATCGGGAEIYHHHSYERRFWLDVKPLCRTCHGEEHRVYES